MLKRCPRLFRHGGRHSRTDRNRSGWRWAAKPRAATGAYEPRHSDRVTFRPVREDLFSEHPTPLPTAIPDTVLKIYLSAYEKPRLEYTRDDMRNYIQAQLIPVFEKQLEMLQATYIAPPTDMISLPTEVLTTVHSSTQGGETAAEVQVHDYQQYAQQQAQELHAHISKQLDQVRKGGRPFCAELESWEHVTTIPAAPFKWSYKHKRKFQELVYRQMFQVYFYVKDPVLEDKLMKLHSWISPGVEVEYDLVTTENTTLLEYHKP